MKSLEYTLSGWPDYGADEELKQYLSVELSLQQTKDASCGECMLSFQPH